MELGLSDDDEVAPLKERLLLNAGMNNQSSKPTSKLFLTTSPDMTLETRNKSKTINFSGRRSPSVTLPSPHNDTEQKDDSLVEDEHNILASLFESSEDENSEPERKRCKQEDERIVQSVSPVFHRTTSSHALPSRSESSPDSITIFRNSAGRKKMQENLIQKKTEGINSERKSSHERQSLDLSKFGARNSEINVDSEHAQSSSEKINVDRYNERKRQNGEKLVSQKLKSPSFLCNSYDEAGNASTDEESPTKKTRRKVDFEFRGSSDTDRERIHQSWNRKGKLVVSKTGVVKSKVKGLWKTDLACSAPRRGIDSSGTSDAGRDVEGADRELNVETSISPVFGKSKSSGLHLAAYREKLANNISFNWEDNIPSICEENEKSKRRIQHGPHDRRDGVKGHVRSNGLCFSSKHRHSKGRGEDRDPSLSGQNHDSHDNGSQGGDGCYSKSRTSSTDPRFYPAVEDVSMKHNRRHHHHHRHHHPREPEKQKQETNYKPSKEKRTSQKQLDPKSSSRYNKFLPGREHSRQQGREELNSSNQSMGSSNSKKDPYAKLISELKRDNQQESNNRHASSSSRKEKVHRGRGETLRRDIDTSSSGLVEETTSSGKHRRRAHQRKHNHPSPHSTNSVPEDSTDPACSRMPLDLSLTDYSQEHRSMPERGRKTRSSVILDDEDEEVILEGVTSFVGAHRGFWGGDGRPRSVTEIVDDEDDEPIILLEEEELIWTPPRTSRRCREVSIQGFSSGEYVTPRAAAAIQQLESDEAMARRLQLEFDREEATIAPPQYHASPVFDHRPLVSSSTVNAVTTGSFSGSISLSFTSHMLPWLEMTTETSRPRRRGPQRGNRRSQRSHNHPVYMETEIDNYERLLDLAEHIGPAVPQGLPVEVLSRLPTFKFQEPDEGRMKEEDMNCTICMSEYEVNEELRRLPCFHAYHTICIDKWFEQNSACPICRVRVQLD